MSKTYTDVGIILKRWNYKERDRMVRVLGFARGKITARLISGKKITSKLAGNCEPFIVSEFFFAESKTIDILAGSVPVETLHRLRSDPYRYACAGFFSELVDRLIEDGQPDEELYMYVLGVFRVFDAQPAHILLLASAVLQFFVLIGYRPELSECVICRKKIQPEEGNQWNMHIWGVQCPLCVSEEMTIPITIAAIKIIRFLFNEHIEMSRSMQLSAQEWEETFALVLAFTHYRVGQELLSERLLHGLDWSKNSTFNNL